MTSKLGKRLRREIKANGLTMVLYAFRWLAHGQRWHARTQRASGTVDMWTPLRHVEKWAGYWKRLGDTPEPVKAGVNGGHATLLDELLAGRLAPNGHVHYVGNTEPPKLVGFEGPGNITFQGGSDA